MSLVTRLSSSPRCRPSKKDSGSRCTLSSTSERNAVMVFCTVALSSRICTQSNSATTKYRTRASASVRRTAAKSTPWPGTTFIPDSRSAKALSPRARAAATACALVIPAGRCRPMAPLNSRSVAWPRTRGMMTPMTVPVTASVSTPAASHRCGASRFIRRPVEPQKSRDRIACGGGAAPRGRWSIGPFTAPPRSRRSPTARWRIRHKWHSRPVAIRGCRRRRSPRCRRRPPGRPVRQSKSVV